MRSNREPAINFREVVKRCLCNIGGVVSDSILYEYYCFHRSILHLNSQAIVVKSREYLQK